MQAETEAERRRDAHLKIQLGGLIVKAGLAEMSKDRLLGLLLDGKDRALDPDTAARFSARGAEAFRD